MNRRVSGVRAALFGAGLLLASSRAWAPPLCAGRPIVERETLTLTVRAVTIDGAAMDTPSGTFRLQSGCALQALDGDLLDPDAPTTIRPTFWGLEATP